MGLVLVLAMPILFQLTHSIDVVFALVFALFTVNVVFLPAANRLKQLSAEERAAGKTYLYGEASDEEGNKAAARMQGPEGYDFTVQTALKIAERIIAGHAPRGFQTPAKAYGAEMVMEIPGVTREDVKDVI